MKDTFILKTKYGSIINRLSDKQAGVLFKMLFNYVENGANAGSTDERVDMAFEFIKMDLDAFAESYQKKLTGRSEQGRLGNLKRWNRDLYDRVVSGELTLEKAEEIIEATNSSLSDKNIAKRQNNRLATSLSLNDNVNDNDISFLKKETKSDVVVSDLENENSESPIETLQTPKEQSVGGRKKFTIPTPEEVQAYCNERNNGISGQQFCDFYSSKGWKVGSQPMKDWKASVRTWEGKRRETTAPTSPTSQVSPIVTSPKRFYYDENGVEITY